MHKDNRYDVIKTMIEAGKITEFSQMFAYIPKSVMAVDLNSSYRRLNRLNKQLDDLKVAEIHAISKLIGVKMDVVYTLIEKPFLAKKAEQGRKRKH